MKIKHKLLTDYQFTTVDKKIFLIKSGTLIDDYVYKIKGESIQIDKGIVEANPQIFAPVDWKAELLTHMKISKFPTPTQFHKKLIPFIEEMIISSIQQIQAPIEIKDDSKIKDLELKEKDLELKEKDLESKESEFNSREKRIKDKEEEVDIRLKRVEKREEDYKNELKDLDKKEDDLRTRSREITEKKLDLEDKLQFVNQKERNFDRSVLESSKTLDQKYAELQQKIDKDLAAVTKKERELELLSKELNRKEESLLQLKTDLEEVEKYLTIKVEEVNLEEESLMKLDQEIRDWEKTHWKFQRNTPPPSAIPETMSVELKQRFGIK